jgi:hypothetical protein
MELYVLVVKIQDVFIISAFSRKKVRKINKKKSDRRKKKQQPQAKSRNRTRLAGIRFAYYTTRDYGYLVGFKMASRVGGIML